MAKSHAKIYIHYVWATKNRERILTKEVLEKIKQHIREYCGKKDIYVIAVNGYLDHIHLFVDLPPVQSVAGAINLIKGESSHWINEKGLFQGKFHWQKRYSAFSVSASQKSVVTRYIQNQEAHHGKKSFQEELEAFYKKHGLDPKDING